MKQVPRFPGPFAAVLNVPTQSACTFSAQYFNCIIPSGACLFAVSLQAEIWHCGFQHAGCPSSWLTDRHLSQNLRGNYSEIKIHRLDRKEEWTPSRLLLVWEVRSGVSGLHYGHYVDEMKACLSVLRVKTTLGIIRMGGNRQRTNICSQSNEVPDSRRVYYKQILLFPCGAMNDLGLSNYLPPKLFGCVIKIIDVWSIIILKYPYDLQCVCAASSHREELHSGHK